MLALENETLHRLLSSNRKALQKTRALLDESRNSNASHPTSERQDLAATLAEEYLAAQPDGAIRHLVLANEYPRVGKEYGNGFVHQRVKQYLDAGVAVDVVCAGYSVDQDLYQYDGVRVLTGHGEEITQILKRQTYTSVSIHFLNRRIWNALEPFLADLDVHVFLHGYECSRWVRRLWNYRTGKDLERAIERSIDLQGFWHEVLHHPHQPKSYVFVSDWWRQAVNDDMRVTFPTDRVHVVHNYINSELFAYVPKDPEQRFSLLWIRSASNRNYANDIAIRVIELLAKSVHWDRCRVTIIGDGRYFPEFERRLGKFENVHIEQRWATQREIAEHHKTHGIFLVPSRLDSQGVSRDEAMSSGLVPATNRVAAIPEFVDSDSGIIGNPEEAKGLAAGIERLWENPNEFLRLSESAAKRVRVQSGRETTIEREMKILGIGME
jgi:glycosyltransferase involved in cell wall biosynthesis